ncbi:MAG: hypothetical protein KGO93_01535 [Cyanobacteria bacterium REEB446]|nr:hypothetical protein [Cyanobacteria bacterium REEB446]
MPYRFKSIPAGKVIRILALVPKSLIALKSPLAASSIASTLPLGWINGIGPLAAVPVKVLPATPPNKGG